MMDTVFFSIAYCPVLFNTEPLRPVGSAGTPLRRGEIRLEIDTSRYISPELHISVKFCEKTGRNVLTIVRAPCYHLVNEFKQCVDFMEDMDKNSR